MSAPEKMPAEVVEIRAEICGACPTPCSQQIATDFHRAPCSECPLAGRRWGPYGQCKRFGLGDAVAAFATPIARALGMDCIDPATQQLRPQSGCAQRQAALNRAVPNLFNPKSPIVTEPARATAKPNPK